MSISFLAPLSLHIWQAEQILCQRFCAWIGVHISLLVVCRVSSHTKDKGWEREMNLGRKAKKGRTVGLTGDGKGQGRPQRVFCYRAGDITRAIVYGGIEREEKIYGQPTWFSGRRGLCISLGTSAKIGGLFLCFDRLVCSQ